MPIRPENRNRYPADWKLRSYFVRFVRGRGMCEWCGVRHGAIGYRDAEGSFRECSSVDEVLAIGEAPVKIILTTAHVWDSAPEASSLLNLAGLCQRCHLFHDRDIHKANAQRTREARAGQSRLFV